MYGDHESPWEPRGHRGGPWGGRHGGPWGGRHGGPWGGPGPSGPPPWVHEIVRQFGGPDLADEFIGRPRRPRARRGDVRAAILEVLAGDEMNGYQLIQQISERSNGAWKPSPGSVYPTIQQLEDEGLVEGRDVDGRRMLRLTDAGRAYVEEHPDEMAATWAAFEAQDRDSRRTSGPGRLGGDLLPVASQVMSAMWQIVTTGTAQQRAEATEILTETRRQLYQLLADGNPGGDGDRDDGPRTGESRDD